jgi:TPR repeat protein
MRRFLFAVFLVVACATVAAADAIGDAESTYNRGDYTKAARLLRPLADQGNARAQFNLGVMYERGQGVPQFDTEAVQWYRLAADEGYAHAQSNLGVMYYAGHAVPQNDREAFKWIRRAAEQGQANAQGNLGLMYAKGRGDPQDVARAYMWSSVASEALGGVDGREAEKNRGLAASQMTAAQIVKAQEMTRRCQQSKFKVCD